MSNHSAWAACGEQPPSPGQASQLWTQRHLFVWWLLLHPRCSQRRAKIHFMPLSDSAFGQQRCLAACPPPQQERKQTLANLARQAKQPNHTLEVTNHWKYRTCHRKTYRQGHKQAYRVRGDSSEASQIAKPMGRITSRPWARPRGRIRNIACAIQNW